MPDYSEARIYSIRAPGTDDIYVGSTTISLAKRMANHRAAFKRWKAGKDHNYSSFRLLEREGAYIELIEKFPCETKEQLNKREGEIIRDTPSCINRCVAGRNPSEYYQENKEVYSKRNSDYYQANRERLVEKQRLYRANRNSPVE